MTKKSEDTFYEVLKIDPRASIPEIAAAYHSAKNAFSRDSLATYSLFSPEETQAILSRLDEAYQTLCNVEKRMAYDRSLAGIEETAVPLPATETIMLNPTNASALASIPPPSSPEAPEAPKDSPAIAANGPLPEYETYTGAVLAEIRERRGLSLDDVCRITKIPMKFVKAIERDIFDALPARVYLHGFVKNLAYLYRIDSRVVTRNYLESLDKKTVRKPDKKLELFPKAA